MQRDSFVRYESFSIAINLLPEENQLHATTFIINYWLYGTEPDRAIDPIAYAIFVMAKPQIDANNKRFINWCKGQSLIGNPKINQKLTSSEPARNLM